MITAEQKSALRDFVKRWKGRGYEKGDTQQFWLQLLGAIGYEHKDSVLFEHHLTSGGYIDAWLRESNIMVEQKAMTVDLDKPELRQGVMKTPFKQVLDYAENVPLAMQPSFLVTCNFKTFRVYDRNKYDKAVLEENAFEFSLEDLINHPDYLNFILDPANSRLEKEKAVSIKAGELIGQLYDKLREGYINPDSPEAMHALNVLCVRLVFCLYCEDADLFVKDSFLNYLKGVAPSDVRLKLKHLFHALDTQKSERDPYDTGIKIFPYVNGGLFREEIEIPNFTQEILDFLLNKVAAPVDWSQISPTIFGGIFESTLNPETRRSGGMHYTSPENIHKVIDPLFLNDLKAEFQAIQEDEDLTPRQKKNRFSKFHKKLCGLTFFDPACGSGNFLTETHLCLRKLEDRVLDELKGGQIEFGAKEDEESGERISLNQFYGIEINDFAVAVAETALWISRLKANGETMMLLDLPGDDFPLNESAHIIHGNALRLNWNEILPARQCSFIMGNPPFIGYSNHTKDQEVDRASIFGKVKTVDYVACWYWKSAEYMGDLPIRTAFVSTNSICQGQQVEPIWKPLFDKGFHIDFAWPTFVWNNDASDQAHVHVVIVGFSKQNQVERTLFVNNKFVHPKNINAYLTASPNIFIQKHSKPLCDVPPMIAGGKPSDGQNLLMNTTEMNALVDACPDAKKWIKPFSMGAEFIKGQDRWCLWLVGITPDELDAMPLVKARVEAVKEIRLTSKKEATRKKAKTPELFDEVRPPRGKSYIAIPKVSSERRNYIPMGFVTNGMIPGDKLFFISDATLYVFGILMSQFHNAWMRVVAGRLKSDYSYANTIVYNNFIWPEPTDEQRQDIEACAKAVLDARDNHPEDSLATLYDPDKMPADLLEAHKALDSAVEAAYGVDFQGDEEKIVTHLFKLYEKAIRPTSNPKPLKVKVKLKK